MRKLFPAVRKFFEDHLISLWVLANIVGMFLASLNYVGPFQKLWLETSPFNQVLVSHLVSIIYAFFFGAVQAAFFKVINQGGFYIQWVLKTWLAISFVIIFNVFIFPETIFSWLNPVFVKNITNYSFMISGLKGIEIYAPRNVFGGILITILLVIPQGLISGVVLGFLQKTLIIDRNLAKRWLIYVTIAITFGLMAYSILATSIVSTTHNSFLLHSRLIGSSVIGLSYGIATRKLVKNFLRVYEYG